MSGDWGASTPTRHETRAGNISWTGRIVRIVDKRWEETTCDHRHKRRATATECGERTARRFNKFDKTTLKGGEHDRESGRRSQSPRSADDGLHRGDQGQR